MYHFFMRFSFFRIKTSSFVLSFVTVNKPYMYVHVLHGCKVVPVCNSYIAISVENNYNRLFSRFTVDMYQYYIHTYQQADHLSVEM